MRRPIGLLAALAVLALIPSRADAQRGGRGTVNTPFGQFSMGEMRAAGGNPFAAEAMREQKMMMQYQQQVMKQEQQYMQMMARQQKARQDYLKQHPEAARAEADAQFAAQHARRKSKSLTSTAKAKPKAFAGKAATAPGTEAPSTTKAAGKPEGR